MNKDIPMLRRTFIVALLAPLPSVALAAADGHHGTHGHKAAEGAKAVEAAKAPDGGTRDAATYFTNLELVTQDGRKVRFYDDVLAGKTVVINVIYTNCQDACPLITQQLNAVRKLLPEFGRQVHFVTLSSDPARDTPQAMKKFAQTQNADVEGWTFLTGRKENLDHILKKLGQHTATVESHSTLLIAGNVPAKRWSKIRPEAPPQAIAARLIAMAGGAEVPLPDAIGIRH
jgi:cytochrome oxidase Cu insertion factor (SCO1/SenC/PrrC family)